MKKSALFLGPTIVLTVLFYLLAYFFLPPPPPSASMMVLFAGVAAVLVWLWQLGFRKARARRSGRVVLLLISLACQLALALCHPVQAKTLFRAQAPSDDSVPMSTVCRLDTGPRAGTTFNYSRSAPLGSRCQDGAGSTGVIIGAHKLGGAGGDEGKHEYNPQPMPPPPPAGPPMKTDGMPRVTGTALLVKKQVEETGYGLYSYALLTHAPEASELPRYQAFFKALIDLPTASNLAEYVQKNRINITYLLLASTPSGWKTWSSNAQVDYVISHYDYARCAAILASLPKHTGTGPVIASSLAPMSLDQHPHPVLVQDLSTAQPVLMGDYVKKFVMQAAQDHFWQPDTLEAFALSLRNVLETAAIGLGMSRDAIMSWVTYFK